MLRVLALALFLLPLSTRAREWQVDPAGSSLTFQGQYEGQAFDGRFKTFQAAIHYDANALDTSRFDVTVDLASVDTNSSERDEALLGADFFDTGKFPQAHFVTSGFAKTADGGVEAEGMLTIRDHTQPVTLKVDFAETGNSATLAVRTVLKRKDFGLGASSDWSDIGTDVSVKGQLILSARAQ